MVGKRRGIKQRRDESEVKGGCVIHQLVSVIYLTRALQVSCLMCIADIPNWICIYIGWSQETYPIPPSFFISYLDNCIIAKIEWLKFDFLMFLMLKPSGNFCSSSLLRSCCFLSGIFRKDCAWIGCVVQTAHTIGSYHTVKYVVGMIQGTL